MKCSICEKEMRKGYLFSSKDGAFSFANEVPGVFENAKNADGFVEITKLKPSHRTRIEAECCEEGVAYSDKEFAHLYEEGVEEEGLKCTLWLLFVEQRDQSLMSQSLLSDDELSMNSSFRLCSKSRFCAGCA